MFGHRWSITGMVGSCKDACCFISSTILPGTLNISSIQQTWFHTQLKLSQIPKRDVSTQSRSANKLPCFSFVVFGDHKSQWVILRQLHCTITCLIRVWGSPSQHRTSSRWETACSSQQKKHRAKPLAPLLLSIRAQCLASHDALWGPRAESFLWRSNSQLMQH